MQNSEILNQSGSGYQAIFVMQDTLIMLQCLSHMTKGEAVMKRTNVILDEKLVDECMKTTGITTPNSMIDHALRELLRHERQKKYLN